PPGRVYFFFQAEDGIRALHVTGVQTCALPIFAGQAVAEDPGQGHVRLEGSLARGVGLRPARLHRSSSSVGRLLSAWRAARRAGRSEGRRARRGGGGGWRAGRGAARTRTAPAGL